MEEKAGRFFRGTFFQLLYPVDWEMQIIEDIPAFYDPMSGGVLQIAASRSSESPFDLSQEMQKFLTGQGIEYRPERVASFVTADGRPCQACEFTKTDRFWMVYMIADADRLLIVMYNGDELPDADQARNISDVVGSIRFF